MIDTSIARLEERVRRLEDRMRIERLMGAYCEYVDRNEQEALLDLFTEDAVFDFGFGRVYRGRSELRDLFERLDTNDATSHHLSNVHITFESRDAARCEAVVYAYHRRRGSGGEVHLWGRYSDEVRRIGEEWRFVRRSLRAAAEGGTSPHPGKTTFYERIERLGR